MEFVKFKRAVHAQFNQLAAGVDMLFLTNVDKDALWDCYLNSFPEEERQSHNCNNCKHYIRHYGRVVAIKKTKKKFLLFDADKLKRSINAALSRRAEANVVTRRYGLRQQVLYLMYYGEE